jgi:hypothetical protein
MNKTADKNRKKIEKAVLKLMKKQDFEHITVSDICAEAFLLYQKLQEQWLSETCSCA